MTIDQSVILCGAIYEDCHCVLPLEHSGPHVCEESCRGMFYGMGRQDSNDRTPVRMPLTGMWVPSSVWRSKAEKFGYPEGFVE